MTQAIPFVHCPPGLFWHGETLCFRSEYGDDAYIVASGEFFVGGVRRENRNSLMVAPVDPDDADAALRTVADSRVAQHARLYLAQARFVQTVRGMFLPNRAVEWCLTNPGRVLAASLLVTIILLAIGLDLV